MSDYASTRIQLLDEEISAWMPWKRRIRAILRDHELEGIIDGIDVCPAPADAAKPTPDELKAIAKWIKSDGKARSKIELASGNSQMVHIAGAMTAAQMWTQLCTVKEARGQLGIMSYRRRLARTMADGTVILKSHIDGCEETIRLYNTLYTPAAQNNLLSVTRIDDAGGEASFKDGTAQIRNKDGRLVLRGKKKFRLYWLEARAVVGNTANIRTTEDNSWETWHRRYGHISDSKLELLMKNQSVERLTVDPASKTEVKCGSCIKAKTHRKSFPLKARHRGKDAGGGIHSDLWGPARTRSTEGSYYYISFTDDATRRIIVLFLKTKDEAKTKVMDHIAWLERQHGLKPKWIRVDEGSKYLNAKLRSALAAKGIELHITAPYSQSQNGVSERMNRSLVELARAMLAAKNLPKKLWEFAVTHAAYIRNRSPTKALPSRITPHEAFTKEKPNVHFQEFGAPVWIFREDVKTLSKLDDSGLK
jgi:transposase InsO family protein